MKFFTLVTCICVGGAVGSVSALLAAPDRAQDRLQTQVAAINVEDNVQPEESVILEKYWRQQLREGVPSEVYQEFVEKYQNLNKGSQHTLAHIFGENLYEVMDLDGVAICDDTFDFGCYHSFFGRAIEDNGLDVITTLDEKCTAKHGEGATGCPHGIGHGVLIEVGDDKLLEALQACKTLQWQGELGGCVGGVFMEYNLNAMDNGRVRPMPEGGEYTPCAALPEQFLTACYFAQPSWWGRHYEDDFRKLGQLCAAIPHPQYKEYCFKGVGVVNVGGNPQDIPSLRSECAKMPTQDAVLQCIGGATWSLQYMPDYSESWPAMCNNFRSDEALYTQCLREKDVI